MTTALTIMHPAQPTRPQTERITQLEMPPQERLVGVSNDATRPAGLVLPVHCDRPLSAPLRPIRLQTESRALSRRGDQHAQ